ncbi:MAG TPA: hypothetical protein VF523_16190 [Burkholderiales bacterium]
MSEISIGFEMTDVLMVRAIREDCIAVAQEFVAARDVLIILASTAVFALALTRESHWLWLFAGLPPAIFAVLGLVWLVAYLWLPRVAKSRLAHLPNRHIQVKASEAELSFQTANQRLVVAWRELKSIKRRPSFWHVCLRSGTRIPIPADRLSREAVSFLERKLAELGQDAQGAG